MKMRKNIIFLSLTIALLTSLIAVATYSYFTASTNLTNKITTNVKLPLRPTFAVSGGGELALNIKRENVLNDNFVGNFIAAMKEITVTLTGEPGTTCTYNIYYKDTSSDSTMLRNWDFSFYLYRNTIAKIEGEMISSLKQTSAGVPKITPFFGGSTTPFNNAKPVLTIPSGSTSVSDTWQFKLAFLNLGQDQSYLANKTFKGEVYIGDVTCT